MGWNAPFDQHLLRRDGAQLGAWGVDVDGAAVGGGRGGLGEVDVDFNVLRAEAVEDFRAAAEDDRDLSRGDPGLFEVGGEGEDADGEMFESAGIGLGDDGVAAIAFDALADGEPDEDGEEEGEALLPWVVGDELAERHGGSGGALGRAEPAEPVAGFVASDEHLGQHGAEFLDGDVAGEVAAVGVRDLAGFLGDDDDDGIGFLGQADGGAVAG
jgi:hypothetical protein